MTNPDLENLAERTAAARMLLNLHRSDPANWSGEEVRRLFALISALTYEPLTKDMRRLIIASRLVAWEDPNPEAVKELREASEAFAADVPWEDEPPPRMSDNYTGEAL